MHSLSLWRLPLVIFIFWRGIRLCLRPYFFAGDRASDLLGLKTVDINIRRFPDNSGFLFNHVWTKTLRSGDPHVFPFKRGRNKQVCPVAGIELYFFDL